MIMRSGSLLKSLFSSIKDPQGLLQELLAKNKPFQEKRSLAQTGGALKITVAQALAEISRNPEQVDLLLRSKALIG